MDEKFNIIIPAHNEEASIGGLLEGLLDVTGRKDIIVVDDGSTDGTYAIARSFGVRVKRHGRNMGKGAAIITGIQMADSEKIVLIDGDGQHYPGDIPLLVKGLEENDLVVGARFSRRAGMPLHRLLANRLIQFIISAKAKDISDPLSGFRAFKKRFFRQLREKDFRIDLEILFTALDEGKKVREVPIRVSYGKNTGSKFNNPFSMTAIWHYAMLLAYSLAWVILPVPVRKKERY